MKTINNEEPLEQIYTMELHKIAVVSTSDLFTTVLRVPGGWVYNSCRISEGMLSSVFVPFSNEFLPVNKNTTTLIPRGAGKEIYYWDTKMIKKMGLTNG